MQTNWSQRSLQGV